VSEDQPEYKIDSDWERPTEIGIGSTAITIFVGELLFEFSSHGQWVAKAQSWFRNSGHRSDDCICVDALGRIVSCGLHFRRAMEEDAFPVKVYLKHV
jgi:hypothetical protein